MTGPSYVRETTGATVRWEPDEEIEMSDGSTIHSSHASATAFENLAICDGCSVDHEHEVDKETAESVREEFQRLVDNPTEIDETIINL